VVLIAHCTLVSESDTWSGPPYALITCAHGEDAATPHAALFVVEGLETYRVEWSRTGTGGRQDTPGM
jgi:hypothetical protein